MELTFEEIEMVKKDLSEHQQYLLKELKQVGELQKQLERNESCGWHRDTIIYDKRYCRDCKLVLCELPNVWRFEHRTYCDKHKQK